ncbi:hypothetical protein EDD17DRAFT_1586216, partial [Pisolithus thermaeus]
NRLPRTARTGGMIQNNKMKTIVFRMALLLPSVRSGVDMGALFILVPADSHTFHLVMCRECMNSRLSCRSRNRTVKGT